MDAEASTGSRAHFPVGAECFARCDTDGVFRRALVTDLAEDECVVVVFVGLGTRQVCPVAALASVPVTDLTTTLRCGLNLSVDLSRYTKKPLI